MPCDVVSYHEKTHPSKPYTIVWTGEPAGPVSAEVAAARAQFDHQDPLRPSAGARKFSDFSARPSTTVSSSTRKSLARSASKTCSAYGFTRSEKRARDWNSTTPTADSTSATGLYSTCCARISTSSADTHNVAETPLWEERRRSLTGATDPRTRRGGANQCGGRASPGGFRGHGPQTPRERIQEARRPHAHSRYCGRSHTPFLVRSGTPGRAPRRVSGVGHSSCRTRATSERCSRRSSVPASAARAGTRRS